MAHRCPKCQQVIIGAGHLYEGKTYCDQCYSEIIQKVEKREKDRVEVFEYIRQLFGFSELPTSWIAQLDSWVDNGQYKFKGIQCTLYYVYEIKGLEKNVEFGLTPVKRYYDEARQWNTNQKTIVEQNLQSQPKYETKVVTISQPISHKKKKEYRIEDL